MSDSLRYVRAAFLAPANLLGLTSAAVGSVAVHSPTAALVALGVETLYLATLPFANAFQRAVRASTPEAAAETPEGLLEELSTSQREHYFQLRALRDDIEGNYRKLPGGRVLAASSQQRVDALLTSFLRLIATLNHYRKYLNVTDRQTVERELAQLVEETQSETNARLKEVKERRVEILRKRVARFVQAEESREVVSHQLAGIEDLLRLTHEQSIAIRDPESVGRQLEVLTAEVESTEETVREMERFMDFAEESAPALPHGSRVRT